MVQFSKMDTKPAVYAGPYGPAAMFHEFENIEKPFWDWTKHA
jgi:lipopolysaccharide biosynthesis protein